MLQRGLFIGAENGTRTRDPNLGKVVLYQLSYFRVVWDCKYMKYFLYCKKNLSFLRKN